MISLRVGSVGPAVRRMQEVLAAYLATDRLIPDGVFGANTRAALVLVQRRLGVDDDGIYGPATRAALWSAMGADPKTGVAKYQRDGVTVWNCTLDATPLTHHTSHRHRDLAEIDCVMLHSTGCRMPEYENVPAAWDRVHAHAGITHAGHIVLLQPWTLLIYHGTRLHGRTVGIEVAGNREGILGQDSTRWHGGGGPHALTEGQLSAAVVLGQMLREQLPSWRNVIAHRQTDGDREADPGAEVWQKIALPWRQNYKLGDLNGAAFGQGRRIPREWDPEKRARYW